MSLFVRVSTCAFQGTKRMMHDAFLKRPPKNINKCIDSKLIGNHDIIVNKKLKNNEVIADNEWTEIRKDLLNLYQWTLSESSVDALIYDLCEYHNRSDQAKNYYKFLKRNQYEISLNILGRYLRYLSRNKDVTKAEEEEICNICDYIKEKHPLLDARTCSNCIMALALTKRWKEGFAILDMLHFSTTPGQGVICALIKAAFRNKEPEIAWKLMNEYIEKFPMTHEVYTDYLEYCKQNFKDKNLEKEIEKVFYFWREHFIVPVDFVLEEYMKTFSTLGYTTSFTSIYKEEKCLKCKTNLQNSTLSESEFKILAQSVLKKVIIAKDLYKHTSPKELKRYSDFIQNLKPYDVIIDGLNVAYISVKNGRGSIDNISKVVNLLLKENKKRILVIGRSHLRQWSFKAMKQLEEKVDVFLLDNISEDDPFLLHLTLISGPQTYFVSRDLMRQHQFKLEDQNLKNLFKRWQLSRQYTFAPNQPCLVRPVLVEINAQKAHNGWHIPSTRNQNVPPPVIYTLPELWACIMKK